MLFIIVALILSLDQLSKCIITKKLVLQQSIPVIQGVFHLTLIHNRGAAFGILRNQLYLFIFVSLVAIILIFSILKKHKNKTLSLYSVSLACILGGALGNLIDRLMCGHVIDFLDFRVWPVFNIADSAISVGAVLLAYSIFRKSEPKT
jgi:signal peptidase II